MAVEARLDSEGEWGKAPTTAGRRGLMPGQRGDHVLWYNKRYGREIDPPVTAEAIRQILIDVVNAQEGDRIMVHQVSNIVPDSSDSVTASSTEAPKSAESPEPV